MATKTKKITLEALEARDTVEAMLNGLRMLEANGYRSGDVVEELAGATVRLGGSIDFDFAREEDLPAVIASFLRPEDVVMRFQADYADGAFFGFVDTGHSLFTQIALCAPVHPYKLKVGEDTHVVCHTGAGNTAIHLQRIA
jgi:hypothetical protein